MKTVKIKIVNPDRVSQSGGVKVEHIGKVFHMHDTHCVAYNPEWKGCLTDRGVTVKNFSRHEFEVLKEESE